MGRAALGQTALSRAPLAFVDLEMTGLDPKRDRIIEVCVERVVGGELKQRLCTLVRPSGAALTSLGEVHGITAAELQDAPLFGEVAPRLLQLLDGALLVAHAARHDIAFLQAELSRLPMPWSRPLYLDTLSLARQQLSLPANGLGHLAEHFAIENARPHRADNDVTVLRAVLQHMLAGRAAGTVAELLQLSRARVDVAAVVDAAQRAQLAGRAARLRYRPSGKAPQELSFCTTEVRADLDPPRVLGYLLPSRGRRELRADRILSFEILDP